MYYNCYCLSGVHLEAKVSQNCHVHYHVKHLGSLRFSPRENKETGRDNQDVGWDMSIPLKLILNLDRNGRLFH